MKQILQNIKTGRTELMDVPAPACRPGHVLLASRVSLVSVGTERMLVDFGKAGWLEKVRQQPKKVKQVLDKIRTVVYKASGQTKGASNLLRLSARRRKRHKRQVCPHAAFGTHGPGNDWTAKIVKSMI